jgi:hypothetical protein
LFVVVVKGTVVVELGLTDEDDKPNVVGLPDAAA